MKKRLISILLTVLMVMSLFSGMSVSAYADDAIDSSYYKEYTLVNGDYVLRICQKMGINYYTCKEAIMALNNITSENGFRYLSVGQTVKIPASDSAAVSIVSSKGNGTTTGTTSTGTTGTAASANVVGYLIPYTMQRGETVLGVCNSLGINFTQQSSLIQAANGIKSWSSVKAGDTILLPAAKTPAVGTTCYAITAHKVASGETTYAICQKYGINYANNTKLLEALNPKTNFSSIKAGASMNLPVVTTIKAAASTTTGTTTGSTTGTTTGTTTTTTTAKSHEIQANINTTYGSMEFYVNNKSVNTAKEGDVVTVNVTTKDGRAVDSVVIKYADGRADVKLESNSFIMPNCNVRVDANIKSGYEIKINSNYSFKTVAQVGGINVSSAASGSSVKIASTDPSYEVKEVNAYYSTMLGLKKTVVSVNDQFCFTMPNKDVTVDVTLQPVETYSFFRADPNYGSFDIQVSGNSVSKAAKGAKVTVVWQAMAGYDISKINVYKADKLGNYNTADTINVFNNSFTMPGSPVYIEVEFACTQNLISIDAVEGGKLVAKVGGVAVTEAATGKDVVVAGKAHAEAVGYLDEIKDLVVTRKADGHRVAVTANSDGTYTFKMPAGGVNISGALKSEEIYSVTVSFNAKGSENKVTLKADGYENWSVVDNNSGAHQVYAVGTRITLNTLARDTHAFTKFEVKENGIFNQEMTDMANEQGLLIMPANNVEVKATFTAGEIAIDPAEIKGSGVVSYMVSSDGVTYRAANSCKIGDFVRIIAKPENPIFQVTKKSITVTSDKTGKALTLNDNLEFQMPEGGVNITVEFVGAEHVAHLYVVDNTAGIANPNHLQGKSMVEARIYDGPYPIVDTASPYTEIKVKSGEALVIYQTEASKNKYTIEKIEVISTKSGSHYEGGLEYIKDKYRVWVEDDDISIKVYLKEKTSKTISLSNVSWNTSKGSVGSTIGEYTNTVVNTAEVGDIVCIVPAALDSYFVEADSLTIKRNSDNGAFTMGAADTANADIIDGKFYPVTSGGKVVAWKYKMPEGGVTAHVEFKSAKYNMTLNVVDTKGVSLLGKGYIAVVNHENEALYEVSNDIVKDIPYGYPVRISLSSSGAELYEIKSVTIPGVSVNSNNSFWMPNKPVTAEVVLEELNPAPETVELSYSANDSQMGTLEFFSDSAMTKLLNNEAEVGKEVYIKAIMKAGYKVKEISVKNKLDNTELVQTVGADYKFVMPADGVTIKVTFEAINYTLTIDCAAADNGRVQVQVGNSSTSHIVKKGDTLTVPYNADLNFSMYDTNFDLVSITVKVGSETGVLTNHTVKMPAANMSVDFTLAAK